MLKISIPSRTLWDEANEVFIQVKGADLTLEHSLVSLSKWEMRWKKPFLGTCKRWVICILTSCSNVFINYNIIINN